MNLSKSYREIQNVVIFHVSKQKSMNGEPVDKRDEVWPIDPRKTILFVNKIIHFRPGNKSMIEPPKWLNLQKYRNFQQPSLKTVE